MNTKVLNSGKVKSKKQEPCKFCDFKANRGVILLNKETVRREDLGLVISSDKPSKGAFLEAKVYDKHLPITLKSDYIPINFCPMCGRKLTSGKGVVNYEIKET